MKNILCVLLSLILVLSLVSCSNRPAEVAEAPIVDESNTTSIGNPFTYYDSMEELNEVVGTALCRPAVMGVSDEVFSSLETEDYIMVQYQCKVNGVEYMLRCAATSDDISGIYSAGVEAMGQDVPMETPKLFEDVGCWSIHWATIDGQYVLTIDNTSMDEDTFTSIYEEFYNYTMENMYNKNSEE